MRRGTRVGAAYVAITADGSGINEEIVDSVDAAGKDIEDSGKEHGDRYGESFGEGFLSRMRGRFASRFGDSLDGDGIGSRAGDDAGQSFVDRMSDKVKGLGDKISDELSDRIASRPEQVRRGIDRAFDDDFADRLGDRFAARLIQGMEQRFGDFDIEALLSRSVSGNGRSGGGKDEGFSGVIARLLGKGSRNNVLNFFGSTMGNVVGLVEKAGNLASTFASNMGKAADGATLLQRVMAGFGGGGGGIGALLAKIGSAAPIAVASLGILLVTMSALVSVAGALVGILVALASTITSALVGALAVAAPLLAGLVVAGGLLTAAFTSMTNAQRDYLFKAFYPFKAALTGVGQIIMTEFTRPLYDGQSAIQVWSANLQKALVPLAGVATTTARAFADAGNTITASLSGPGFQNFFRALAVELPTIVRNLSSAFGGFLNGIAGIFGALMPLVTRFSGYLNDVATRFAQWANSANGQNAIVDFANRAVESLKSLWNFVGELGGLLADVLFNPTSQRAGNTIFDRMTNAIKGMRRAFDKALRDGTIERWFNDATKIGAAFWAVLKSLYDLFLALYNSGVITGTAEALQTMANVVSGLSNLLTPLIDALGNGLPGSLGVIPSAVQAAMGPLGNLWQVISGLNNAINELGGKGKSAADISRSGSFNDFYTTTTIPGVTQNGIMGPWAPGTSGNPFPASTPDLPNLEDLFNSGNTALNNTFEQFGGNMPDPTDPIKKGPKFTHFEAALVDEWMNPYGEFAAALIRRGDTMADQIRAAFRDARDAIGAAVEESAKLFTDLLRDSGKSFVEGVGAAAKSTDVNNIIESFQTLINNSIEASNAAIEASNANAQAILDQAYAARDQMINQALDARSAAAQRLASASSPKEAKEAMKILKQTEKDLELARNKGAQLVEQARTAANQVTANAAAQRQRIAAAEAILGQQAVFTMANAVALAQGLAAGNATLADYAAARANVAERLEAATQQLVNALNIRDQYNTAVADSVRQFASLMSAQAKTVNGIQQALTYGDITENLRDRLTKVRKFQENLRQLLAMGLSNDAYKQLVDAGVENGGAYAEAILQGGSGAVSEVNNLTGQINEAANQLGGAASNALYQAGVDAAQGLVDGLVSLSNELETAATQLGNAIAQAIRDALGIRSPSRVLIHDMESVGDGAVVGLDNQHVKVSAAAARLADQIAVSPEVAAYAARQGTAPTTEGSEVSGNQPGTLIQWNGDIVTPTEDPKAVTDEVLNELTGRLT